MFWCEFVDIFFWIWFPLKDSKFAFVIFCIVQHCDCRFSVKNRKIQTAKSISIIQSNKNRSSIKQTWKFKLRVIELWKINNYWNKVSTKLLFCLFQYRLFEFKNCKFLKAILMHLNNSVQLTISLFVIIQSILMKWLCTC